MKFPDAPRKQTIPQAAGQGKTPCGPCQRDVRETQQRVQDPVPLWGTVHHKTQENIGADAVKVRKAPELLLTTVFSCG